MVEFKKFNGLLFLNIFLIKLTKVKSDVVQKILNEGQFQFIFRGIGELGFL